MPVVLNASMTMSWCFASETTPYSQSVLTELLRSYAEVPALWLVEVTNVFAISHQRTRSTVRAKG